jgi:LPS sulfotransferase NodH
MTAPARSYLVCATPRCGGALLCHLLATTGIAGRPEEYFEALRHCGLPRRLEEYFDPDRHANTVRRLSSGELPDDECRRQPHSLWNPKSYDRYLG